MRVAICDDERETCSHLRTVLENFTGLPPLSIDVYYSGEELCEALHTGRVYDLYILDIMLQSINGVQVGQLIREKFSGQGVQLLFISSQQSYAMALFDLHPLNFLIKPVHQGKLYTCMKRAVDQAEHSIPTFLYQYKRNLHCVAYRNIRYFESDNKTILIHMVDGTHRISMRLSEVLRCNPPPDFIQVHQSFVLNFEYVRRLEYTKAFLDNGEEIPISYAYRKIARSYMMQSLVAQQETP